jgi:hypothetical protein
MYHSIQFYFDMAICFQLMLDTNTRSSIYTHGTELKYKFELKFKQVSKINLSGYIWVSEYKLPEEQIVVNTFAAPCTYESQGTINFVCQCVKELVSCILMFARVSI